ncbi:MAG: DNA repair protein RecN [Clostridia bacterium]|nr:DNA repair protein RecN [Clostridia bacterium]
MLRSINIENIAIIEKCNIDFFEGFNVLTGETGAGKSIIIDSINAVTGQRTSKELVRSGCEKASVSAVFDNISKDALHLLSEYGVDCEDSSVMLLRTINSDGRSVCKVNGVSVNVSALKDIGRLLINIHGQHDNQALLDPETHIGFIDSYGNYPDIINDYQSCYNELRSVRKKLRSLSTDEDEKLRTIDLLKYQINEIEAAQITVGQLKELTEKRELIRNSEKLRLSLEICKTLLSGDDDSSGAETMLSQSLNEFSGASKIIGSTDKLLARFDFAVTEITDISAEIRDLCDSIAFDPNELDECEQRIDLINSLVKKYGGSEASVLEFLENAKSKLENINVSDELIIELEHQSEVLEDKLVELGQRLTEARQKAADDFSKRVCDVLRYLEMPKVVFIVDIKPKMYTIYGCDNVEFLISANLGQEARPLAKIASGGELSRIMLAIKSIMSNFDDAGTLIFDEIDTGISGKAADKVGRQMKRLSKDRQVLCVTHLAQIAASADSHYLIEKSSSDSNTYTNVTPISGDQRVKEIARIMSGGNITENLYKTAKELIENHSVL